MANVENHIQSVKKVEGEKRNVEDAKQCGENPQKASQCVENVENEKQCGKNPEDTILGVENERQSKCIVQEEGNNAFKEPAESDEVGPIPAAPEECGDSEEGLMEEEDTACKTPLLKRKQGSETCGSKAKKSGTSGEQEEQTESLSNEEEEEQAESESSEEDETEVGAADSQSLTDSPLFSASQFDELCKVYKCSFKKQKI